MEGNHSRCGTEEMYSRATAEKIIEEEKKAALSQLHQR
jgi:hypothetical protein